MPNNNIQIRILNLFFGILILILPILPNLYPVYPITVLLAIFAFGLVIIGFTNIIIGTSDMTKHDWVRNSEFFIGIAASAIGFYLFFLIFLTRTVETDSLVIIFLIFFLIVSCSTNLACIFEDNAKRLAKFILGAVGLCSLTILVIFLTSLFFGVNISLIAFSITFMIYGSSRILLGFVGMFQKP
ncbi:MAG: hypothetical protein ACFFAH_04375 [Promethearchaeota archaeon]